MFTLTKQSMARTAGMARLPAGSPKPRAEVRHVLLDEALGGLAIADDLQADREPEIDRALIDRRVREQHVILQCALEAGQKISGAVIGCGGCKLVRPAGSQKG